MFYPETTGSLIETRKMPPNNESVYTTDHSASVLRTHGWRTAANSAAYLVPHLRPGMAVLDVGCGPGSITVDLARLVGPGGHVTGVDQAADPLDEARSLASKRGVGNVSFRVGDVHALPFADDSFDAVHAHQVLQHVADAEGALGEMRRVAKPGGLVACRESAGLEAWLRLATRMGTDKGGNPHPEARIHVWAEKAGFARESITKSAGAWCFSSDEEREYWGGSMRERAESSGWAEMALEKGYATREELDGVARGWDAFRKDPDAWFGMLHGEIICRK